MRGVQCKQASQVKILRRPNRLAGTANQASDSSSGNVEAKSRIGATGTISTSHEDHEHERWRTNKNRTPNKIGNDVFGEKLLTESADKAVGDVIEVDVRNNHHIVCVGGGENGGSSEDSPSICPAAATAATSATGNAIVQSHQNYHQLNQNTLNDSPSRQQHRLHSHQPKALSSDTNNSGAGSKNLMKTYQERADEYAKARLRILGSAFPENDTSLTKSDEVVRILNLDRNNASNSLKNGPTTVDNYDEQSYDNLSKLSSDDNNRQSLTEASESAVVISNNISDSGNFTSSRTRRL